jgi:hypothetical protein
VQQWRRRRRRGGERRRGLLLLLLLLRRLVGALLPLFCGRGLGTGTSHLCVAVCGLCMVRL